MGQNYDSNVRMVYVWSPSQHERALRLWSRACEAKRNARGLDELPFHLLFMSHAQFMAAEDPLHRSLYESLTKPSQTKLVARNNNTQPSVPRACVPVGQAERRIGEDGSMLDEATRKFLLAARLLKTNQVALSRLALDFLTSRPGMVEALAPSLGRMMAADNYIAQALAMERFALAFFGALDIPACIDTDDPPIIPVLVSTTTDGAARPKLVIKVEPSLSEHLLMLWPHGGDELAKTFETLLRALLRSGVRLSAGAKETPTRV